MSERFEKIYISVNEFVSSWEKEIYELNNLDYFTFLLINHLGYYLEHDFFSKDQNTPYLRIDPDEIATLSFNIGDGFESFLENNCFGDCTLNCPTRLNERVNPNDMEVNRTHLNIIQIMNGTNITKKQFLLTDILNYVVLDTLFDFYNYEIGLDLDDADIGLMQLADFITVMLEKFIENNGQSYLINPKESAVEQFESSISEAENDWEHLSAESYEESEENEEWRHGQLSVSHFVQEYISQAKNHDIVRDRILNFFSTFAADYAGIVKIDDFSSEDLEEFFIFWLIREISLEKEITFENIKTIFERFFLSLELSHNIDLKILFDEIQMTCFASAENALGCIRSYFDKNSLINGVLEANVENDRIISGFFQVEKISDNGFLRLRDIHFNKDYLNVKINFTDPAELDKMILLASIKMTSYGWRVINLEYIFPQMTKPYLH